MAVQGNSLLTPQFILSRISAKKLFEHYTDGMVERCLYSSPLREDLNPSFSYKELNSGYQYADFATSESGDIFDFIQAKFKCTFTESLQIVNADFNITAMTMLYNITPREVIGLPSRKETKIQVRTNNWNPINLEYWYNYGISKSTLQHFDVHPISYYWIDGVRYKPKTSYCYKFGNGYYKILNTNVDKTDKWRTNCSSEIWHGVNQLPKSGELLFITSSLKDIMVLYECGYIAVAPQKETHKIPEKIMKYLDRRFEETLLLYNNDKAGIESAALLQETYPLTSYIVPSIPNITDPSDYSKEFGVLALQTLIQKWTTKKQKQVDGLNEIEQPVTLMKEN
jgi:hypothetical protein